MKAVTRYQTADGTTYSTAEQATEHERRVVRIDEAVAFLRPIPTDRGLMSGGRGYVQQSAVSVRECKQRLARVAKDVCGDWDGLWDKDPDEVHPLGIAGRIIDDTGFAPLNRAWYRLCCIDRQYREWEQPYFATRPNSDAVAV